MFCAVVAFALACPPSPPPEKAYERLYAPRPADRAVGEEAEPAATEIPSRTLVSCLRVGGDADAAEAAAKDAEAPDEVRTADEADVGAVGEAPAADGSAPDGPPPIVYGERIKLLCRLKNVGDAPIEITQTTDPMMDLVPHVVGPGGMETPLTLYGQLNGFAAGSRTTTKLAPGRTHDKVVGLSRRYDLSMAGEYRVWFTRPVFLSGSYTPLDSEPVRFTVGP